MSLPWYRHRWPWLLLSGPAAVLAAGAVTAWIAFASADGLVAEDYYKQGMAINKVLAREEHAHNGIPRSASRRAGARGRGPVRTRAGRETERRRH